MKGWEAEQSWVCIVQDIVLRMKPVAQRACWQINTATNGLWTRNENKESTCLD
jgi:hypothetical protein